MFAEIGAEGWAVIITAACIGVGGIVANVITLITGYWERLRAAERESARVIREEDTAEKVKEVKEVLAEAKTATDVKLDEIARTGEENVRVGNMVHVLVNDRHGKALEAVAALSRWKANQHGASDHDTLAADQAEKALAEHQGQQGMVDADKAKRENS